jgi:hypothetical protein
MNRKSPTRTREALPSRRRPTIWYRYAVSIGVDWRRTARSLAEGLKKAKHIFYAHRGKHGTLSRCGIRRTAITASLIFTSELRQLHHVGRNPPRFVNHVPPYQFSHFDKSMAAPNQRYGLYSIAVLRAGATPVAEFPFAFGEKPGATQTSVANQTVGDPLAFPMATCASCEMFP